MAVVRRAGQPVELGPRDRLSLLGVSGSERLGQAPRGVRARLADDARLVLRRTAGQPQLGRDPPQVRRHGRRLHRRILARHGRQPDARRAERLAPWLLADTRRRRSLRAADAAVPLRLRRRRRRQRLREHRRRPPRPRRFPRGRRSPAEAEEAGKSAPRTWACDSIPATKGPGLLVRDVIPQTPADDEKSKIRAGETILSIDGTVVDPGDGPDPRPQRPVRPRDSPASQKQRRRRAGGDAPSDVATPWSAQGSTKSGFATTGR